MRYTQYYNYESLSEERQQKLNKDLLDRAYKNKTNIAFDDKYNIMAIAGTNITDTKDLEADILIPFPQMFDKTDRVQMAIQRYDNRPYPPSIIVGHSLGSTIASRIRTIRADDFKDYGDVYLYNHPVPTWTETRTRVHHFRHHFDPISRFDLAATSTYTLGDPHSYH